MQLQGTTGADVLTGTKNADDILGGAGNDQILGGAGNDNLEGDGGNDTLDGGTGDDHLDGGQGDDVLLGAAGADKLQGGVGNDTLDGGDGNDELRGGQGDDQLTGGAGTDRAIFSGSRLDYSVTRIDDTHVLVTDLRPGGDGTDTLTVDIEQLKFSDGVVELSDAIETAILGMDESEGLDGTQGSDRITGGKGNDYIYGNLGFDVAVFSGNRSDYTVKQISDGYVEIYHIGGDHADGLDQLYDVEALQFADGSFAIADLAVTGGRTLLGSDGDDGLYYEGEEDNLIIGGAGNDYAIGMEGNDTIIGGSGDDQIDGFSGEDIAVFSGNISDYTLGWDSDRWIQISDSRTDGDGVDLLAGIETLQFADGVTDVRSLFGDMAEQLHGTSREELIDGRGGDDFIAGWAGNDTLLGGSGNDVLDGGTGRDRLFGGDGSDYLNFDADDIIVDGGDGFDTAVAYDLIDARSISFESIETLFLNGSFAVFDGRGLTTDMTYYVYAQDVRFTGGNHTDVVWGGEAAQGHFDGGAGDDGLFTGLGNDTLLGGTGNDTLFGNFGDDLLDGGRGDDLLEGNYGSDRLVGGSGRDTFVFNMFALGDDVIEDFELGYDTIDMKWQGLSFDQLQISQSGTSAVITYGSNTLTLEHFSASDVEASMFWF